MYFGSKLGAAACFFLKAKKIKDKTRSKIIMVRDFMCVEASISKTVVPTATLTSPYYTHVKELKFMMYRNRSNCCLHCDT